MTTWSIKKHLTPCPLPKAEREKTKTHHEKHLFRH